MTKSYKKICDYCKNQIEMSDKEGKWQPYNVDNGKHDCRDRDRKQEPTNEAQIAAVVKTLQNVIKELEALQKQ